MKRFLILSIIHFSAERFFRLSFLGFVLTNIVKSNAGVGNESSTVVHSVDDACDGVQLLAYQTILPVLLLFCIVGSLVNVLIYNLPYFDGSTAVIFLKAFLFLVVISRTVFS